MDEIKQKMCIANRDNIAIIVKIVTIGEIVAKYRRRIYEKKRL